MVDADSMVNDATPIIYRKYIKKFSISTVVIVVQFPANRVAALTGQ